MSVPKFDENGNELEEKSLVVNYKLQSACVEDNQHPLPNKA